MTDGLRRVEGQGPLVPRHLEPASPQEASSKDFKKLLLESLDQVNKLQEEADAKVEQLLTGQEDNVVEVLSAVRKADIAFTLLMEIRNKLLEAYQQIEQMRF